MLLQISTKVPTSAQSHSQISRVLPTLPVTTLTHEHPVLVWVTGVLYDGNNVRSLLRYVYQVAAASV